MASVGSRGDSYDNAMAESFNSHYKSELIHRKGPWRNVEHVEWATLNYVDWFNNRRIHESLDYVPSVEFETHNYGTHESESLAAEKRIALYRTRVESNTQVTSSWGISYQYS